MLSDLLSLLPLDNILIYALIFLLFLSHGKGENLKFSRVGTVFIFFAGFLVFWNGSSFSFCCSKKEFVNDLVNWWGDNCLSHNTSHCILCFSCFCNSKDLLKRKHKSFTYPKVSFFASWNLYSPLCYYGFWSCKFSPLKNKKVSHEQKIYFSNHAAPWVVCSCGKKTLSHA